MNLPGIDITKLPEEAQRALLGKLLKRKYRNQLADSPSDKSELIRYPLSANQKGLWVFQQLNPDSYAYNTPLSIRIYGLLNKEALRSALEKLIQRHNILRTRIYINGGSAESEVVKDGSVFLDTHDFSELSEIDVSVNLKSFLRQPFRLTDGPLMRAHLCTTAPGETILLLVFHHLIFDGGSVAPLLNDLSRFYSAYINGTDFELEPVQSSYADFVTWQKNLIASDQGRQHRTYWHQQFRGELPALNIPLDHPRPGVPTYSGAVHSMRFASALSTQIRRLARAENVSIFAVMLSLFYVLLYRYSNQEDIVVGTPLEIRPGRRFESSIGYFVNMVGIRSTITGDMLFRELLKGVQSNVYAALEHGAYPFAELVREVAPDYDRSRSPLFQAVFAYQNWVRDISSDMDSTGDSSGLRFEPMLDVHQEGEFEFTVEMVETTDGHQLFFKYNPDLFDEATIIRMARHFNTLAKSLVDDPDSAVAKLSLLSAEERHQILTEWNDTQIDILKDESVHQLFEAYESKRPDEIAVICGNEALSYQQLNARANQLGRHLQKLGVGPDVLVGICMERSIDMIIGLLAILKTGGAYIPVDPAYPPKRISYMLDDSKSPILITQKSVVKSLSKVSQRLFVIDRDWEVVSSESETNLEVSSQNEHLAYCIYTSGSTGLPKGVLISHGSLLNLIKWHQRTFAVSAADRATQIAGPAFDASVWEIWPYLSIGAKLYLPTAETVANPNQLRNWLIAEAITISFVPTPLAEELISLTWPEKTQLRIMLTGGDRLTRLPVSPLPFELVNNYGPTENTVVTTSGVVKWDKSLNTPPLIGTPIDNTQVYILSRDLQPLPIGVPGEIHIAGASLARGYLNRPQLTAEKFITNPFSENSDSRLYKTGDLACYMPDGNIKFIGRIDDQVKLRGFRIEIGEVENVLAQHDRVRHAAVLLREDRPGKKQLTAYVALNHRASISVDILKAYLRTKLPIYMVPSAIICLDSLPMTPNGKIDRRALPIPTEVDSAQNAPHVAPRNGIENKMAGLWSSVLDQERIGIHDDFFELGGHSLLAVRLMQAIEKSFGKLLPVATLFEAPTIAEMAERIGSGGASRSYSPLVAIRSRREKPPLFCVHPGDGNVFYFSELARQLGPDQPFYALQAYGLEPGTKPLSSIAEMAATYIETIRMVYPHGPYFIGGLCGGGTIAFEMAQQLKQSGESVPLLVLFDALAPHMYTPIDEARFFIGFARDFDGLSNANLLPIFGRRRNINPNFGIEAIREDLFSLSHDERLELLWECAQEAGILQPDISVHYLARVFSVYSGIYSGILSYQPMPYGGRIVFFRALDDMINPKDEKAASSTRWIEDSDSLELVRKFRETPFLGWNQYASDSIQMIDMPGNHFSMLALPNVEILKTHLKSCLMDAS